jgi:hypothetical protein
LPADLFQRRASTQPIASGNFSPRIAYPQSDTVSANPRSGLHQWRRRAAKRGRAHGPAQPRRKPERRYPSVGRRVETRESERNSSPGSDATYGRSRRRADIAGCGLGRLNWAESAPTGLAARRAAVRAIADIPLGARKKLHHPKWASTGLPASGGMQRLRAASCIA